MKERIFRSILSVTLAVLAAALGTLFFVFHRQSEKSAQGALRKAAELASVTVTENKIGKTLSDSENGVYRLLPDGTVEENGEYGAFAADIEKAKKNGESFSRRTDHDGNEAYFYALKLSDGSILCLSEPCEPEWKTVLTLLRACLLILIPLTAAASFAARRLSGDIVRPITELDPEHPERLAIYSELQPVAARLVEQNRLIARKIREMTVKQSEFAAITDNMSEGMLVIGKNAEILSYNKSAEIMLSPSKGEMPKTVTARDFDEHFRNAVADALSGEKSTVVIRSDKSRVYSAMINPVYHQNSVEGAVIVILDETEKERREALRREFTSNVSHELKTPLTSISGFAEIIMNGLCEGEEKRFARNIYREAKRLIVLVGDIIKLNRLDGGEFAFDENDPDLLEIAEQTAERLENIAENAGVSLTVKGESARVRGNSQILEEMLYNLADNGIKYNNPGGHVELSVFSEPDGKGVGVTCRDDGIGIPEDQQNRVFERFFRVDKSRSKAIGGTGLGLSIVKHGALSHGAEISLESKEGKGTAITLHFPPPTQTE